MRFGLNQINFVKELNSANVMMQPGVSFFIPADARTEGGGNAGSGTPPGEEEWVLANWELLHVGKVVRFQEKDHGRWHRGRVFTKEANTVTMSYA